VFSVACISNWSSCSGAPSGQTMIYSSHLQNLVGRQPPRPLDCVCLLFWGGLNCKLAIPIMVKGSRCMTGKQVSVCVA
jgi:hypothetical protein